VVTWKGKTFLCAAGLPAPNQAYVGTPGGIPNLSATSGLAKQLSNDNLMAAQNESGCHVSLGGALGDPAFTAVFYGGSFPIND